jgi:hypothetical protein
VGGYWRCVVNDINVAEEELVKCDICLKEIPSSEAQNTEVSDYVAHFCGLDCYNQWLEKARQSE